MHFVEKKDGTLIDLRKAALFTMALFPLNVVFLNLPAGIISGFIVVGLGMITMILGAVVFNHPRTSDRTYNFLIVIIVNLLLVYLLDTNILG